MKIKFENESCFACKYAILALHKYTFLSDLSFCYVVGLLLAGVIAIESRNT